jgi:UDP:flavonoid glycosyltransferase YjiC (YdhE family)
MVVTADLPVAMITHDDFKSFVEEAGIMFEPIGVAPARARVEAKFGEQLAAAGLMAKLRLTKEFFHPLVGTWADAAFVALNTLSQRWGLACVLTGTLGAYFVPSLCEALQVKFAVLHLMPYHPTSEFAPPVGGDGSSWVLTRLKWSMADKVGWSMLWREPVNALRARIQLRPYPDDTTALKRDADAGIPIVMAYATAVVPTPPDWRLGQVHVVGPLFYNEPAAAPPDELVAFLSRHASMLHESACSAAPKSKLPVFFGLGSMLEAAFTTQAERRAFLSKIHCVLSSAGVAAIVTTHGCTEPPAPLSPSIMNFSGSVAHSWLFPQCSIVISHGGAGTVHAALLAACPSIVLPALPQESDQLFWAARLHAIGASVSPGIPVASIKTGGRLRRTLVATIASEAVFARAKELSAKLTAEAAGSAARAADVLMRACGVLTDASMDELEAIAKQRDLSGSVSNGPLKWSRESGLTAEHLKAQPYPRPCIRCGKPVKEGDYVSCAGSAVGVYEDCGDDVVHRGCVLQDRTCVRCARVISPFATVRQEAGGLVCC